MKHLTELHYSNRLLALPANIRLGWMEMAAANPLAYYIATVKSFIGQAPDDTKRSQNKKSFFPNSDDNLTFKISTTISFPFNGNNRSC